MREPDIRAELENLKDQPLEDVYDEYIYPFTSFLKHLNRVQDNYEHYSELLSLCDLQREDILHHLEFHRTNAIERSKLMTKLIEVQRTRRVVKTHMECCQTIMDSWLKTGHVAIHKTLTGQITQLNRLSGRTYSYRTSVVQETLGLSPDGEEAGD